MFGIEPQSLSQNLNITSLGSSPFTQTPHIHLDLKPDLPSQKPRQASPTADTILHCRLYHCIRDTSQLNGSPDSRMSPTHGSHAVNPPDLSPEPFETGLCSVWPAAQQYYVLQSSSFGTPW